MGSNQGRSDRDRGKGYSDFLQAVKQVKELSELQADQFAREGGLVDSLVRGTEWQKVKMTQLRRFFAEVKRITTRAEKADGAQQLAKLREQVNMLHPLLAYAAGRGTIRREARDVLIALLDPDKLKSQADFKRLDDVMTSLVAYHKFHYEKS